MTRNWSLLIPPLLLCSCTGEGSGFMDASLIHRVQRGDLEIAVREQGEVQAARDTQVGSTLQGRAMLIYLIEEGSFVQTGERLAELDVSEIEERRAAHAIQVANMEANVDQAQKNFEIMEDEIVASENTAENRLKIAGMRKEKFVGQPRNLPEGMGDLKDGANQEMVDKLRDLLDTEALNDPMAEVKYADLVNNVLELLGSVESLKMEMGEMANQILQEIDQIRLARADLKLAAETLEHSRNLYEKDFITKNEFERDEISYKRQLSNVTVKWNNLQLLINYTLPETLIGLEQEMENAELGLRSVEATSGARRVREQATLRSAELHHMLIRERLENYDEQIQNAIIRAPAPGLVVYAEDGDDWDERVYEGMEVRKGRTLILLPDVSTMVTNFNVHEAQINQVAVGQAAIVRLDAFPERTFSGRVNMVSTLPDSRSRWNNQDLRVYKCTVLLEEDNSEMTLRPGMSGTVEISVGVREDVLNIPTTALKRRGDTHYAWKVTPEGPLAVEVQLGSSNLTHVEIVSGLQEGDEIYLVQPPGMLLPGADPAEQEAGPAETGGDVGLPVEASGRRGGRGSGGGQDGEGGRDQR